MRHGHDAHGAHHATVQVLRDVAMKGKRADDARIPKIHAQSRARIGPEASPGSHIYGVEQIRLRHPLLRARHDEKMQLMHVERVYLPRAIFYRPFLHVPLPDRNIGLLPVGIKDLRCMALLGDKEVSTTVGSRCFGEVQRP